MRGLKMSVLNQTDRWSEKWSLITVEKSDRGDLGKKWGKK